MEYLYEMIFKRKSMRRFNDTLHISEGELNKVKKQFEKLKPIYESISTDLEIVPKKKTTCKRGEYCLLIYSESKEHYLLNVGYMFEQLDLYLASMNIGVCWYGFGKTKDAYRKNMKFVIMLAIGKCREEDFRRDIHKSKRKEGKEICQGEFDEEIVDIVRYAPSSCNMQPWKIRYAENKITVYRTTRVNSIMPESKRPYYNSIDMGIFLCFLEILLKKKSYRFKREIFDRNEEGQEDKEEIKIAEYKII